MTIRTERDLAVAISRGDAPSPSVYFGSTYFAARFSGTGVAWRNALQEFCLRDRDEWLSESMQTRIVGTPLITEHPPGTTLDGESFVQRCVGVVTYGYVKGDELWAICRVVDPGIAKIIDSGDYDTSPAVIFAPGDNDVAMTPDGYPLLVEGNPAFLDHLALVDKSGGNRGVWSKGSDEAVGVETSEGAAGGSDA